MLSVTSSKIHLMRLMSAIWLVKLTIKFRILHMNIYKECKVKKVNKESNQFYINDNIINRFKTIKYYFHWKYIFSQNEIWIFSILFVNTLWMMNNFPDV